MYKYLAQFKAILTQTAPHRNRTYFTTNIWGGKLISIFGLMVGLCKYGHIYIIVYSVLVVLVLTSCIIVRQSYISSLGIQGAQ